MVYVTADLHGYKLEDFQTLLESAGFGDEDDLFVIGDVVDRGADGVAILQWLMDQPNAQLLLGKRYQRGDSVFLLLFLSAWH